tara:strand:+ start:209 stop:961 length:753 start_codon:yes stop_codon:yes gene_type:complete
MTNSKKGRIISSERIKQLKSLLFRINIDPPKGEESSIESQKYYSLIDEALTHTSAEMLINHERLEFLGDAVLRLAATEFIDENFSNMNVGNRSALRAHLVSDKWLAEVGSRIQIKEILLLGNKAQKDLFASATLEAEATEALIGALFENIKELEIIKKWLIPYWIETSREVLSDPHKKNPKSALQEWSQSKSHELPEYITIEKSKKHGDPSRFLSKVKVSGKEIGQGEGRSIQESEKSAAKCALEIIENI